MIIARRVLFYCFVALYMALCPLLILYSFGYIFSPSDNQLSRTGLIHVSTIPEGAQVYLWESRYAYKTPTSINELLPGDYQVTLRLKGHRTWTHRVTVTAGVSSAFEDILLLPERIIPYRFSSDETFTTLVPLPGSAAFLAKKGSRLEDCYYFDREKKQLLPVVADSSFSQEFTVLSASANKDSVSLVAYSGSLWDKKFLLVEAPEKNGSPKDISKLFTDRPLSFIWSQENPGTIFAVYKGYIDRVDAQPMSVYPRYIENAKGFGTGGGWVYILSKDNLVTKLPWEKKEEEPLFKEGYFGGYPFSKSRFYRILPLENDRLLIWGDKGDVVSTTPPCVIAESDVTGVEYSRRNSKLLYWTKEEVWIADFNKQGLVKSADGLSGQVELQRVYAQGHAIGQCFWVYNGTHILMRDRDDLFLLELSPDGKHHVEPLVTVKHNSDIVYSEESGKLYYLDPQGELMRTDIIPGPGGDDEL